MKINITGTTNKVNKLLAAKALFIKEFNRLELTCVVCRCPSLKGTARPYLSLLIPTKNLEPCFGSAYNSKLFFLNSNSRLSTLLVGGWFERYYLECLLESKVFYSSLPVFVQDPKLLNTRYKRFISTDMVVYCLSELLRDEKMISQLVGL